MLEFKFMIYLINSIMIENKIKKVDCLNEKINESVFKSSLDGSNEKASKRLDEMIKELEKQKKKTDFPKSNEKSLG